MSEPGHTLNQGRRSKAEGEIIIYRNRMERTDEDGEPRGKKEVNSKEKFLSLHRAF